jgi:hypothetical protein
MWEISIKTHITTRRAFLDFFVFDKLCGLIPHRPWLTQKDHRVTKQEGWPGNYCKRMEFPGTLSKPKWNIRNNVTTKRSVPSISYSKHVYGENVKNIVNNKIDLWSLGHNKACSCTVILGPYVYWLRHKDSLGERTEGLAISQPLYVKMIYRGLEGCVFIFMC